MFCRKLINIFKNRTVYYKNNSFSTTLSNPLVDSHIDHAFIINTDNIEAIKTNISRRKGVGDIELIHNLLDSYKKCSDTTKQQEILQNIEKEINKLPNFTHPDVLNIGNEPKIIRKYGEPRNFPFEVKSFAALCKHLNVLRTEHLGNFCGTKAYYLLNELAELVCKY